MAVWSLFSLVYLAQAIVSVYCVFHARDHRLPYTFLFSALLFDVVSSSASLASLLIYSNGVIFETMSFITAEAVSTFFFFWSMPLLFLSLVSVLRNRYKGLVGEIASVGWNSYFAFKMVVCGLTCVTVVLGTACAAMDVVRLRARFGVIPPENFNTSRQTLLNLTYAFNAFWYVTAVVVGIMAGAVHYVMRQLDITDKVGLMKPCLSRSKDANDTPVDIPSDALHCFAGLPFAYYQQPYPQRINNSWQHQAGHQLRS